MIFQSNALHASATNNNRWSATLYTISIHALHAECDDTIFSPSICVAPFQSTHSMRVRLSMGNPCNSTRNKFQSTHSMRSATPMLTSQRLRCSVFSIHALHAECDMKRGEINGFRRRFQSTHSMRSATATNGYRVWNGVISIHALHAECDQSAHEGR